MNPALAKVVGRPRRSAPNIYPRSTDGEIPGMGWTVSQMQSSAYNQPDPLHGNWASLMIPNGVSLAHAISKSSVSVPDGPVTHSIYAKAAGYQFLYIYDGTVYKTFDFGLGVVGANGTATAGIINCGNGWYRCYITVIYGSPTTKNMEISLLSTDSILNYAGDTTSGMYVFGLQANIGHTPTAYVPVH